MSIEHFESFINKTDTCWLWRGGKAARARSKDSKATNYGSYKGKLAHRASYELYNGPIEKGMFIRHSCDNPICVNPQHLIQGTAKQNGEDMAIRRRSTWGERNPSNVLNRNQVTAILAYKAMGYRGRDLANSFNITEQTICDITKRRSWKNVSLDYMLKEWV